MGSLKIEKMHFVEWGESLIRLQYSLVDVLVGMTGLGSACQLGCTLLLCALSDGASYQDSWWKTAVQYIVNGTITAVRYRIYESTTEYPKVYRVFDRI